MTDPVPDHLPVFVASSPAGVTSDEYWGCVLSCLYAYKGLPPPDSDRDNLEILVAELASTTGPVVLVLDDIDVVDKAEEYVGRLLECGGSTRIIVTTRIAGGWRDFVDACPDRVMVTPDVLAFTEEEVRTFLRVSGVPQGHRVSRWIMRRTNGQPTLVSDVCRALTLGGVHASSDPIGFVDTVESMGMMEPAAAAAITNMMRLRSGGNFAEAAQVCDVLASETVSIPDGADDTGMHTRAFCYLQMGTSLLLDARLDDAADMLGRARIAGTGTVVGRAAADSLALTHAVRGTMIDPHLWADVEQQQHLPASEIPGIPAKTAGLVTSVIVALNRLDPDDALDKLIELGEAHEAEELWAFVLYAHGEYALLAGLHADGLRHVESEMRSFARLSSGIAGQLLDAVRADLNLALGRTDEAVRLVGGSSDPLTAAVRARICLLTGDFGGAEMIVHRYGADPRCPPRVSMELFVIGTAAACSQGRRSDARRHLSRAATVSRQTGMLRPFTSLFPSMTREVAELGVELPVDLVRIASEFATFRPSHRMVRLTPREREVLEALLSGSSVGMIAKAQFVSLNTVKTQLRSLYRKLGVHSRSDAIEAAQQVVLV
ncbi:LuxR C-terminal-related transcriptional regulator [Rhodococcus sp. NPDC060086]|uniref:helix-turn-helix domain-containing protein n=1 Tax=Rhodococcus sp. NPDC060086 TaxID=3347055 RepID=UPI003654B14A